MVGIKRSYGVVSAEGVIPRSLSLGHVGAVARSVADAGLGLQAISTDSCDHVAMQADARGLRVGVPRAFFYEDLDPEISAAVEAAIEHVSDMTADVSEIALPVSTDRTLQLAESYAYHQQWIEETPDSYHPETLRRIRAGA